MPERDFELYLSLLSRFLRLKPAQHAEIADELRDHLEQRLEELTARGLSHDDAIRRALDELGDAAELAHHFTRATHIRRRRLIMRCTLGTIGAVAAALLFTTAFWPEASRAPLPARSVAGDVESGSKPESATVAAYPIDEARSAVEDKLSKRLAKLEFIDMPLEKVAAFFGAQTDLDFVFDDAGLDKAGVSKDYPITISITRTQMTARAGLEMILGPLKLAYEIRHGLVVITHPESVHEPFEIQLYKVRQFRTNRVDSQGTDGAAVGQSVKKATIDLAQLTATDIRSDPATDEQKQPPNGTAAAIADLIRSSIEPETWDLFGGECSVTVVDEFPDLLIVRSSRAVHDRIKELIVALHHALNDSAAPGSTGSRLPKALVPNNDRRIPQ